MQLAAQYGDVTFSRYIFPTIPIDARASENNGITVDHEHGDMYVNGQPVQYDYCEQAMADFAKFLTDVGGSVVLVAHNGKSFDFPRYLQQKVCLIHFLWRVARKYSA